MKKIYLPVILLAVAFASGAQDNIKGQEARLLNRLKLAQTDSSRIELLIELGNLFYLNHQDKQAIPYAIQLLEIHEKAQKGLKVASTLTFLGQAYLNCKLYDSACIYWEKSLVLKKEIGDTTLEIDLCKNIGLIYFNDYIFLKSKQYYTRALELSTQRKRPKDISISLLFLGRIASYEQDIALAEQYFNRALKINKENNFRGDVAVTQNALSGLAASKGNFREATDYILQSLRVAEELKDGPLLFTGLNDAAIIFIRTREFDSALVYLSRAEKLTADNKESQAYVTGNIGTAFIGKKNYGKAKAYISQSIRLAEELGLTENLCFRMHNWADIMLYEKRYADALSSLYRSLQLNQLIKNPDMQAKNYLLFGKIYLEIAKDTILQRRPDSLRSVRRSLLLNRSVQYLDASIESCKRLNKLDMLQENYRLLSDANNEQQNYKEALRNMSQYIFYRDSIFNIDEQSKQNKLVEQHGFSLKLTEIEKVNALNRAKAKARQTLFIIIGITILLIAMLSFYYIRKIDKSKFELESARLRQEALNAQISDHFVSNAMDSIRRFIQHNQKEKAGEYLDKFRDLVRDVLINSKKQVIPLVKDLELLETYIEIEALRFTGQGLRYRIKVDDTIDPEYVLVPPMLLQIQTENSIKHGFKKTEGGNLSISVEKKGEHLLLRVEDDGGGRIPAEVNTSDTKRTSVGSILARRIVSTMSKQYSYNIIDLKDANQLPIGTAVEYTLPYIENT